MPPVRRGSSWRPRPPSTLRVDYFCELPLQGAGCPTKWTASHIGWVERSSGNSPWVRFCHWPFWKMGHSLLDGVPESDRIAARRFEIIARRAVD